MDAQQMHYCERCKELWFDIKLSDGVCNRCHQKDHGQSPYLYSHDNRMDPGDIPSDLPALTSIEELLIAPIHISMHIAHIKGAQYRYKGHVMTFLRDVPDVVTRLPRLPKNCNVVLIKPQQTMDDPRRGETMQQFRRSFTVRRDRVQVRCILLQTDSHALQKNFAHPFHPQRWLEFLMQHHPGFHGFSIDYSLLLQLPGDASVLDEIETSEIPDNSALIPEGPEGPIDNAYPTTATIPETVAHNLELEDLRRGTYFFDQPRLALAKEVLTSSQVLVSASRRMQSLLSTGHASKPIGIRSNAAVRGSSPLHSQHCSHAAMLIGQSHANELISLRSTTGSNTSYAIMTVALQGMIASGTQLSIYGCGSLVAAVPDGSLTRVPDAHDTKALPLKTSGSSSQTMVLITIRSSTQSYAAQAVLKVLDRTGSVAVVSSLRTSSYLESLRCSLHSAQLTRSGIAFSVTSQIIGLGCTQMTRRGTQFPCKAASPPCNRTPTLTRISDMS